MKTFRAIVVLAVVLAAAPVCAQDAAKVWNQLAQPVFDPGKSSSVRELALTRDAIRITLTDGTIQFSQPAEGLVFGAAFRGHGRVQVPPPSPLETQQLRLFTKQDTLDMKFTEATFSFTDNTFEEIARQVQWSPATDLRLGELYTRRQEEREDAGAEILPSLFKSVLSADHERTAIFAADLKTEEKGWIHVRFEASKPEEITVGRWVQPRAVKIFDNWLSFPAGGRSSQAAYRDPLSKEDFLIRSYRINASATGGAELRATTWVTLEHQVAQERVLLFMLDSNLRVDSVKDEQGALLPFFQPRDPKNRDQSYGDYVAVVLPQPTREHQSQTLEFQYGGKRVVRKVGAGNFFCQSFGWYPTRENSFATRAHFEINFRTPKKYVLVATGNKVDEATDGDWSISKWKTDVPLAVAGFAFGDYKVYAEKAGAIDVEIYANRNPDDSMAALQTLTDILDPHSQAELGLGALGSLSPSVMAKTVGTEFANTMRVFENYFGPYPYKRVAITDIPYSYGQGWPGLIYLSATSFLDSTQRHQMGFRDEAGANDSFRAHESSHQWWGHRVGWKSYHDQWLSEGFAQFSGNLYVQFRQNEKVYLTRLKRDKEELLQRDQNGHVYESLGPVWMGHRLGSSESPGGYSMVVYSKGGLILHMLRMMLFDARSNTPDERFIKMMQDFCQTFHNQPASTEDFKAIVERHMIPMMDLEQSRRMDWFFRQYVYGTGLAQYELRYTMQDAGEGKWKISGAVMQSGVADGWMDLIPLYVHTEGRAVRLGAFRVARVGENPFEFVLPFKPEKISVNQNEDTLAKFKQ